MPSGGFRKGHVPPALTWEQAEIARICCITSADWRRLQQALDLSRNTISRIKNKTGNYSEEWHRLQLIKETTQETIQGSQKGADFCNLTKAWRPLSR
jgi:hypothetical protein